MKKIKKIYNFVNRNQIVQIRNKEGILTKERT